MAWSLEYWIPFLINLIARKREAGVRRSHASHTIQMVSSIVQCATRVSGAHLPACINLSVRYRRAHTSNFFALTSTKMIHTFWSRLAFRDGLDYLQFEYEANLTMVFWEKSKKPPKMGFLGPLQVPSPNLRGVSKSFIIKWHPDIIFWDISYHRKPTGTRQRA